MRYVLRFWFASALSLALMAGCSDENGEGGSGGAAGAGGSGGTAGSGGTTGFACTEQGIRDAIAAGGGPFTFDCDGPVVTEAEIVIDSDVILDGEGNLALDGNDDHRVISVAEGVAAELIGLTMTNGRANGGGALRNEGTLTLTGVTVSDSWCGSKTCSCGGIENDGTMTLTDSTVSGNYNTIAPVFVGGDGICNSGDLTLINSTVSGNGDGGIRNFGTMAVIHSTLVGRFDPVLDLPDFDLLSSLTMSNSLVVGECLCAAQPCTVASGGYNIESPGNTCGLDTNENDQVNVTEGQLNLGSLQDNGGPTMTHALGAGSIAIDQIPAGDCVDADGAPLTSDQRGVERPQGDSCDVGAVESE